MPAPTFNPQQTLVNPGFLYWAPLGSTLPTNTVTGSVFTDAWPAAWIPQGLTAAGSTFTASTTVEALTPAEQLDPMQYVTTGRTASIAFQLESFTATNLARAMNGATVATTGSTTTTLTQIDPVQVGQETRSMIGWESTDFTVRLVCFQVINQGDFTLEFVKAAADSNTKIPWAANLEKPSATQPFRMWTAGAARVGV